jgi:enoyl-CoA hydratase
MTAPEPLVLVDVVDRVGTMTLNRPAQRNALSSALLAQLDDAFEALEASPEVDVLVLTGADPAFCAGLDLNELGQSGILPSNGRSLADRATGSSKSPFPPHDKPLIGAVNGVAVTGGLELALNCDFLIASERARFGDTHARVGLMPGWGLSFLLSEAVGLRRARQMSATGDFVDAERALAWGLVNVVVPHDQLLPSVQAVATSITTCVQEQVLAMRSLYTDVAGASTAEGWEIEGRHNLAWKANFDPAAVAQRREGVISRGRTQG